MKNARAIWNIVREVAFTVKMVSPPQQVILMHVLHMLTCQVCA